MEDALRKAAAILALILLLIFPSCSHERGSIALVSEGGVAVYLKEGRHVRLISSGSVKAGYIENLSGKDIKDAVSDSISRIYRERI